MILGENNLSGLGKLEVWVLRLPLGDSSLEIFDVQDIILLQLGNLCASDLIDGVIIVFWALDLSSLLQAFFMTPNPRLQGR